MINCNDLTGMHGQCGIADWGFSLKPARRRRMCKRVKIILEIPAVEESYFGS